ncbi:transforming growth factor, beta receptor associated protein 1 [Geranomyces variabilis]|nr:transforming growth factor, beta receptor associated protein 1 [Geranomyces variabilis]
MSSTASFAPFTVVELLRYNPPDATQSTSTPNQPPRTPPRQHSSVLGLGLGSSSSNLTSALLSATGSAPPRSVITAVELCDANLYVGTSDGYLLHYILDRAELSGRDVSEPGSDAGVERMHHIKTSPGVGKRSLDSLLAFPTESKMVVFSDSTVTFLELDTLRQVPPVMCMPVKQAVCFCADKIVQSPVPLTFARRRMLLAGYLGDMLEMEKELPLTDGPVVMMVRHGDRVCAADQHMYKLIFLSSGETIPLFPYDRSLQRPLAAAYSDGEFLLVTATPQGGGLGMFIAQNGEPVRGTLEWPAIPKSLAFQYPYVAALLANNTIEVHNLVNQQLMQKLAFPPGFTLHSMVEATFDLELGTSGLGDGGTIRILVAGGDAVLGIKMAPLRRQIDWLMESDSIEQAIELAEHVSLGQPQEYSNTKLQDLYCRAGLIYLERMLFDQALNMFKKAELDPAVLLEIYEPRVPPLSPSASGEGTTATETADSIIAMIDAHVVKSETELDAKALLVAAKAMLESYLLHVRATYSQADPRLELIDTSLLKLHAAKPDPASLYAFVLARNHVPLETAVTLLQNAQRFYAQSLLLKAHEKHEDVLRIWQQLAAKNLNDPDFPGITIVPKYLESVNDKELVLETLTWLLDIDAQLAVQALMDQVNVFYRFSSEEVSDHLRRHSRAAYLLYLEHLVNERGDKTETYHTELAVSYIEHISRLDGVAAQPIELESQYRSLQSRPPFEVFLWRVQNEATDETRKALLPVRAKLIRLLQDSESYDPSAVIAALNAADVELKFERALVLGRGDDHEAVLQIYLSLGDHVGAERYCLSQPGDVGTKLIARLLALFLAAGDSMALPVHDLLTRHHALTNLTSVLEDLPAHWSLSLVGDYLVSALRVSRAEFTEKRIVKNLARGEHFKIQSKLSSIVHATQPIELKHSDTICIVCGKPIPDPPAPFAARFFPAPGITHVHCR